jgi:hypothetical protein
MSNTPDTANATEVTTVRVQLKQKARIQLSDRMAEGGDWIDIDPAELEAPAFRASVMTEAEVEAARAADKASRGRGKSRAPEGGGMFDGLVKSFTASNLQSLQARRAAEAMKAEMLGKNTKQLP